MNVSPSEMYYAATSLGAGAPFYDDRLKDCSERHRIELIRPKLLPSNSLICDAVNCNAYGIVIEMVNGCPNRVHLKLSGAALRSGMKVWFYWPREGAVEQIDNERHGSYCHLWFFVKTVLKLMQWCEKCYQFFASNTPLWIRPLLKKVYKRLKRKSEGMLSSNIKQAKETHFDTYTKANFDNILDWLVTNAQPIPFPADLTLPSSANPINGVGVYLRTDYWAPINTGGSYGHTCYVAKELASTTNDFKCFMANRFALIDELGLQQKVVPKPSTTCDETSLILANGPYYEFLRSQLSQTQPAYIYERICLGNFVGARLSQELGIPYIVEYNGSELSMRRSFDSDDFEEEKFFLKAEEAAFRQALFISVISEAVRDDLIRRGITEEKVLVNPNGVDLQAYSPMEPNIRELLRRELGFLPSDRIVGFIGTFGGWHGIDVLSEALPLICQRDENIRFLLIGDGNFKHLIDDSIRQHNLGSRVICTGRVPHQRGAELLGACDIFASPHSAHMVDSKFFGSPTKLFEYMAMAGGIVASDLEQIGEVLSPALHATNLTEGIQVTNERSILCTPGSVAEFVEAVVFLSTHPEICHTIGQNARKAAEIDFSWKSHVDRLWQFALSVNKEVVTNPKYENVT